MIRRKCSCKQLLAFTANLQVQLIGMEACSGSHFLGRALREQGHEVRLMPAQYVKPYVQTNKSDYLDAEAIAEAVQRPRMRFVPIKTDERLDLQALHRVRERWVMRRTSVVNQIRSLLLERGLTMPKGRSHVDALLPRILEDAELPLSDSFRVLLTQLKVELDQLTRRVEQVDTVIQQTAKDNESCQRLTEIPRVGPVTATAPIGAVGNAATWLTSRVDEKSIVHLIRGIHGELIIGIHARQNFRVAIGHGAHLNRTRARAPLLDAIDSPAATVTNQRTQRREDRRFQLPQVDSAPEAIAGRLRTV